MAENLLSKLTVGGVQYTIKDAKARADIEEILQKIAGGTHFLGVTTDDLSDGNTITNLTIKVGATETKTIPAADIIDGDIVMKEREGKEGLEFIAAGGKWFELGSTGQLKALAFKDSATGKITTIDSIATEDADVTGTIETNVSVAKITGATATFTGKEATIEADYTPAGSVTGTVTGTTQATVGDYTPAGTITGSISGSATVTLKDYTPEGECDKPSITVTEEDDDALVGATYDSANENLSFTTGTFLTGATAALDAAPVFTGTAKAPEQDSGSCEADVSATDLTFAGTKRAGYTLNGSCETVVDGATTGKILTFTGTPDTATASYTPEANSVVVADITPEVTNGTVSFDLTAAGQAITPVTSEKTITVS